MADDAVIRLAERSQGQGVGCRAVKDKKDFAVGVEEVTQGVTGLGCPRVVAVARRVTVVGLPESLPGLRADARVVVTGELILWHGGHVLGLGFLIAWPLTITDRHDKAQGR